MCPNTDSVYEYEGFGGCESRCRIRIFRPPDGPPVVIATEAAGTNPGTSITNMTAEIATDVTRIHHLAGEPFVWIEHYDDRGDPAVRRNAFGRENGESFDRVEFRRVGTRLTHPEWTRMRKAEVETLTGGLLP